MGLPNLFTSIYLNWIYLELFFFFALGKRRQGQVQRNKKVKYLIPIFLVLIFIFFQKLVEVRCSSLITNMFFVSSVGKIIGKFMW